MNLEFMPRILVSALALQAAAVSADPFEVRGYRQGMSLEQIQRTAKNKGQLVRHLGNLSYVQIVQGETPILSLGLCQDRVFHAYWSVAGGLDRFVKQLDALLKQGLEKRNVGWGSNLDYEGAERHQMSVYFARPGSEKDYYVEAALFSDETHGTTNTQISWWAQAGYCKQEHP